MPPMTLPSMFADSKLWGVCVWRGQVRGVKPLRTARPYHFGSCVREKSQRMDSRPGEPRKESKQGPQMEVTSARWSCQVKVGEGFTLHFDGNNENVGNSAWMQPEPCGLRIQAFLPRQSLKQTKQKQRHIPRKVITHRQERYKAGRPYIRRGKCASSTLTLLHWFHVPAQRFSMLELSKICLDLL